MDKIIRATAGDGFIKMAVITARETVQRAREPYIGSTELRSGEIAEDRDTDVLCQFCDKRYVFSPADLRRILDAKAQNAGLDRYRAEIRLSRLSRKKC